MRMRKGSGRLALLVILGGGALLLAACGGNNSPAASSGAPTTITAASSDSGSSSSEGGGVTTKTIAGEKVNYEDTEDVTGRSSTEVELEDYYFGPTVLTGSAGQKITVELKNTGTTEHNFTLEDQKINEDFAPGDTKEVTITLPDSGTVLFHCEYHEDMGMRGALQVSS